MGGGGGKTWAQCAAQQGDFNASAVVSLSPHMGNSITHKHALCAAPCAVVEERNGELGPTTASTQVGITMQNEGEGPLSIDGDP